ncbi:MAG: hypothetical protein ABEJ72_05900, partial [Candidatus Aenigmatarchaeota archaeon]
GEYDAVVLQFPGVPAKELSLYSLMMNEIPAPSVFVAHEPPTRLRFLPLLRLFDHYTFLSERSLDEFRAAYRWFPLGDTSQQLPYFGVDPDIEQRVKEQKISSSGTGPTIVCPGFLVERKQYHRVV